MPRLSTLCESWASQTLVTSTMPARWVHHGFSAGDLSPRATLGKWSPAFPAIYLCRDRLHRTPAETLIGLANGAVDKLRFAAPFMDAPGLGYIADSVVAATLREVTVEIVRPVGGKREQRAVDALHRSVDENGNPQRFTVLDTAIGAPFPHLKVMTVDGKAAYIGSSNLTAAAFEGRNLELGVVVHGSQVQVIDEFLDMYTTREA